MKFLAEAVAFHKHREEREHPEEEEVFSNSSEEEPSDAEQQLNFLIKTLLERKHFLLKIIFMKEAYISFSKILLYFSA